MAMFNSYVSHYQRVYHSCLVFWSANNLWTKRIPFNSTTPCFMMSALTSWVCKNLHTIGWQLTQLRGDVIYNIIYIYTYYPIASPCISSYNYGSIMGSTMASMVIALCDTKWHLRSSPHSGGLAKLRELQEDFFVEVFQMLLVATSLNRLTDGLVIDGVIHYGIVYRGNEKTIFLMGRHVKIMVVRFRCSLQIQWYRWEEQSIIYNHFINSERGKSCW